MLIAASLSIASALLLTSALTAESIGATPSLLIGVTVAGDISPTLVPRVLDEAADIWRAAGFTIAWLRDEGGGVRPPPLRVWIGDARGTRNSERSMALGWIMFDDDGTPARNIYVSHANAVALLTLTRGLTSRDRMPTAEREALLGRAMGRALAHELGHFLLASKAHTSKGLMRAQRTSSEFFSREHIRFELDPEQLAIVRSRYQPGSLLATATLPAIPAESGGLAESPLDDPTHFRRLARDRETHRR